jgi:hypothetical protein
VFDYAGSIHFHSAYSYDARVPLPDILTDAALAGLHFAVVTDHFRLDARQDGYEGYYSASPGSPRRPPSPDGRGTGAAEGEAKSVLLIVGEEISPRYNHYLALGTTKPVVVWKTDINAQRMIDEVNRQGGFGFIAHPDHAGAPLIGSRAYPWIDWGVRGYAGVGIWDLMTDWSSSLVSSWSMIWSCLCPALALKGPQMKTLARWDELAQKGHCVAIGEIDNHGNRRTLFGIRHRLFPFNFAFRTIRTHVLLDKPLTKNTQEDIKTVLKALREGQSYVSLDIWNDPTGFSFSVYDEKNRAWPGGEFKRQGEAILEAKLPKPGRLRLIRDGRIVKEERKRSALQWDVDLPGVYRVEAQQRIFGRWRPWIYSNPIWVT